MAYSQGGGGCYQQRLPPSHTRRGGGGCCQHRLPSSHRRHFRLGASQTNANDITSQLLHPVAAPFFRARPPAARSLVLCRAQPSPPAAGRLTTSDVRNNSVAASSPPSTKAPLSAFRRDLSPAVLLGRSCSPCSPTTRPITSVVVPWLAEPWPTPSRPCGRKRRCRRALPAAQPARDVLEDRDEALLPLARMQMQARRQQTRYPG